MCQWHGVHVFADEAGNFDFSSKAGASRYFLLTTVSMDDFGAGDASCRYGGNWRGRATVKERTIFTPRKNCRR